MAKELRCELTELPVSGCAHCRPKPVVLDPGGLELLLGPQFTARFAGACGCCDGYINEGDTIAALIDGPGYACPECIARHR